jgi:hypothetical protein
MVEPPPGRLPPPWRIFEMSECFVIQDSRGRNVAWFHFARPATALLKEQIWRRAVNFAGPLLDKAGRDLNPAPRELPNNGQHREAGLA